MKWWPRFLFEFKILDQIHLGVILSVFFWHIYQCFNSYSCFIIWYKYIKIAMKNVVHFVVYPKHETNLWICHENRIVRNSIMTTFAQTYWPFDQLFRSFSQNTYDGQTMKCSPNRKINEVIRFKNVYIWAARTLTTR